MSWYCLALGVVLSLSLPLHSLLAQSPEGYRIEVEVDYYPNDTLILGYYYGRGSYAKDTALKVNGRFVFEDTTSLPQGLYFLLTRPNNNFVQFVVGKQQHFSIRTDYRYLQDSIQVVGSRESAILLEYSRFLKQMSQQANVYREKLNSLILSEEEKEPYRRKLDSLDRVVRQYQDRIKKQYPHSLTASIIRIHWEPTPPTFEYIQDSAARQEAQFWYYKRHYFDSIHPFDDRLIYTPFLHEKITRYVERLTVQIPDSIIKSVDQVLHLFPPTSESFRYFLPYFLNHYSQSRYIGADAVVVHLVNQYYAKGLAPWMKDEDLQKLIAEAKSLEPTLIGKKAPDITVYDSLHRPIRLYDINTPYTILVFWSPDCGHCKKALPKLESWYAHYPEKDSITVLAVCTKLLDKEPHCWKMVREKHFTQLLYASDKYLQSKFAAKYHVNVTPKIFILDKDKKIVIKDIAVEQLDEVMKKIKTLHP